MDVKTTLRIDPELAGLIRRAAQSWAGRHGLPQERSTAAWMRHRLRWAAYAELKGHEQPGVPVWPEELD